MADFKDLIIVFFAGLAIGFILRGGAASVKTYSNEESWEFIKDERGRVLGVNVKRRAHNG